MSVLSKLIEDQATSGAKKALAKSLKSATSDIATDIASKSASKTLSKAIRSDIADELTDNLSKGVSNKLTGAGKSTLAKKAGSTLDGVVSKASGIELPNAKYKTNIRDMGVDNIVEWINKYDPELSEFKSSLSKKNFNKLKSYAKDAYIDSQDALAAKTGVRGKTYLPDLNREQYYADTIGRLKSKGGSMSAKDVPDYMQNHLSNAVNTNQYGRAQYGDNDAILRDLFDDNTSSLSDLYAKYEDIASNTDMGDVYTPFNMAYGLAKQGDDEIERIGQDFANRTLGLKDIDVKSANTGAKKIDVLNLDKVEKAKEPASIIEDIVETPVEKSENPMLAGQIDELRSKIGAGTTPTARPVDTTGTEGFDVKFKDGTDTTIRVGLVLQAQLSNKEHSGSLMI